MEPTGGFHAAGYIAANELGSWGVVGGFFEPEFEIGARDEMCVDVTTDLRSGGRGSVGKLMEARMG